MLRSLRHPGIPRFLDSFASEAGVFNLVMEKAPGASLRAIATKARFADADLILVAHEGMEAFGDLAQIRAAVPLRAPVRVRVWRIARADVPADEDAFVTWLMDRWVDMDRWIDARVNERRANDGNPPSSTDPALVDSREFRA